MRVRSVGRFREMLVRMTLASLNAVRGNISSDPVCAEPEMLGNVRVR